MVARNNLIIGIILVVMGALLVIGRVGLEDILPFLGIVLIVVGILMIVHVLPGTLLIGIVVLAVGILLQINWIPGLPKEVEDFFSIINLVLGIVLIVMGVLKLVGK